MSATSEAMTPVEPTARDEQIFTLTSFLLMLLVFVIPVSQSLKSLLLPITAFSLLMIPDCRKSFSIIYHDFWFISMLSVVFVVALACLWSPAPLTERLVVLGKYSKLFYLPVLALGFCHADLREKSLLIFMLTMLLTAVLSILKSKGLFHYHGGDPGEIFHNHIVTSYMVALAAYVAGWFYFETKGQKRRYGYALIWLLLSYQLVFVNTGRMGFILYAFLMLLLMCFYLSKLGWFLLLAAITCVLLLPHQNQGIWRGMSLLKTEIQQSQEGKENNSFGYRVQFHRYAHTLFDTQPLIGMGTASFAYQFHKDKPIPSWELPLHEPHSQYWFTLAEFGILGMLPLIAFFVGLGLLFFRLQQMRFILLGGLSMFVIANLSDTLLTYSAASYIFILLMAMCVGERIERKS